MKKKVILGLVVFLILAQFIRIDKVNPDVDISKDYMTITAPPQEIKTLLNNACYDCHSNTTKYPWYTNVSPISWWIKGHIKNGRKAMNFSEWSDYKESSKQHKLEECATRIENKWMPLASYMIGHSEAKLSDEERSQLVNWFKK